MPLFAPPSSLELYPPSRLTCFRIITQAQVDGELEICSLPRKLTHGQIRTTVYSNALLEGFPVQLTSILLQRKLFLK